MNPSRPLVGASAALPLDHVAASRSYERSSNKRSKSRRFRVPALANGILGLLVLALLFVCLYGPDKLVETVSPGYICNQSASEAIKVVRRDAVGLLSFGDFLATRAINLNVPAPLLLSIFKMDTATTRKVGRVTYCTGIVTIGLSPEFEQQQSRQSSITPRKRPRTKQDTNFWRSRHLQHLGKQGGSCLVRHSRFSIARKFSTMEIGLSKTYQ